jgi:hypothetical protein
MLGDFAAHVSQDIKMPDGFRRYHSEKYVAIVCDFRTNSAQQDVAVIARDTGTLIYAGTLCSMLACVRDEQFDDNSLISLVNHISVVERRSQESEKEA